MLNSYSADLMKKEDRFNQMWMNVAAVFAQQSHAVRRKVGCVIVHRDRIVSQGWNGTSAGFDNACEDEDGHTLPHVIHAESNAITKLARSTESGEGAVIYTTTSPCIDCAKLIAQTGIQRVYYTELYKSTDGIAYLQKCGIPSIQLATL